MIQQIHTKHGDNVEIAARKDGTAVDVYVVRDGTPIEGAVVHTNQKPAWNRGFQWGLLAGIGLQAALAMAVQLVFG